MGLEEYRKKRRFAVTPEPPGRRAPRRVRRLRFVVQKHRASHLHYDFRLEWDGVLLSWAVPKGPSLDPAVKRLAMAVEDHPLAYADFEGIIPEGEYGGGTVMVWDRGTYVPETPDVGASVRRGELKFTLYGKKLTGSWVLVRTRGRTAAERGAGRTWLLIKHRDAAAVRADVTATQPRSIVTKRLMAEIAMEEGGDVAKAATADPPAEIAALAEKGAADAAAPPAHTRGLALEGARVSVRIPFHATPMLATVAARPFHLPGWVYEEKYDGYRILAYKEGARVTLRSRNARDRTASFAEIAVSLRALPARTLLLDGEVVAFDPDLVSRFQLLQERTRPLVYAVFDCLYLNGRDLRREPLARRRAALVRAIARAERCIPSRRLARNGLAAYRQAVARGFEGLVAKDAATPYVAGRSSRWRKVKVFCDEELVIGGFTAPAGTRARFGALLLGAHRGAALHYVGKVGTGFSEATLESLWRRLKPLVRVTPPFVDPPAERGIQWVAPRLVAQVSFSEWTRDRKLRQPVFLGLRDDKRARDVRLPRERA